MNERPSYGDAEAKRIIERAAVIDAEKGRLMDARALREIAAAGGISPLAVDRALEEQESTTLKFCSRALDVYRGAPGVVRAGLHGTVGRYCGCLTSDVVMAWDGRSGSSSQKLWFPWWRSRRP